jgi:hypothetical protein
VGKGRVAVGSAVAVGKGVFVGNGVAVGVGVGVGKIPQPTNKITDPTAILNVRVNKFISLLM